MTAPARPTRYLLTSSEFAASIGVSPKTLRNWRAKGLGPKPIRLNGRAVAYDPADIEAWVATVKKAGDIAAASWAESEGAA